MEYSKELLAILDDDEQVELSYKAHKTRYVLIGGLVSMAAIGLFATLFLMLGIFGLVGIIIFANESGDMDFSGPIMMVVMGSVVLLIAIINLITRVVRYKNLAYYVTNKRLIIQSGLIGIDFRSMSLDSITIMNVRVDLLDKLVHPTTGSIVFGSSASPIVYANGQNNNSAQINMTFAFQCVEDPYGVYKAIKERISKNV